MYHSCVLKSRHKAHVSNLACTRMAFKAFLCPLFVSEENLLHVRPISAFVLSADTIRGESGPACSMASAFSVDSLPTISISSFLAAIHNNISWCEFRCSRIVRANVRSRHCTIPSITTFSGITVSGARDLGDQIQRTFARVMTESNLHFLVWTRLS